MRIRNKIRENLHDSRFFTLEDAKKWYASTEVVYLGIFSKQKMLGYLRLRRVNQSTLEIGLDLDPKFQGQGIGTEVYNFMIKWLALNSPISNLTLRVLRKNSIAIHLYTKLGFKVVSKTDKDLEMKLKIKSFWS